MHDNNNLKSVSEKINLLKSNIELNTKELNDAQNELKQLFIENANTFFVPWIDFLGALNDEIMIFSLMIDTITFLFRWYLTRNNEVLDESSLEKVQIILNKVIDTIIKIRHQYIHYDAYNEDIHKDDLKINSFYEKIRNMFIK